MVCVETILYFVPYEKNIMAMRQLLTHFIKFFPLRIAP
jgi:hypothetical protein